VEIASEVPGMDEQYELKCAERLSAQGEEGDDGDSGLAVANDKPALKRPPLYKVVLLNDDYTPMERAFFGMNPETATRVMLKVHTEGKGVCGVYSKDVAETKAELVNSYSAECEQPLLCAVEEDEV